MTRTLLGAGKARGTANSEQASGTDRKWVEQRVEHITHVELRDSDALSKFFLCETCVCDINRSVVGSCEQLVHLGQQRIVNFATL